MEDVQVRSSRGTRDAILDAGLLCFAKYGYDATSLRLLGTMASKNTSLVAYHFGSKEGLYREVVRHLFQKMATQFPDGHGADESVVTANASGHTRLKALIVRILAAINIHFISAEPKRKASARLWLSVISTPKPETIDLLRNHLAPLVNEIRLCVREMCPYLDDSDVDLWSSVIQSCCLGQALMAETNLLIWSHAEWWSDPTFMAERLSTVFSFALRHLEPEADHLSSTTFTGAEQ